MIITYDETRNLNLYNYKTQIYLDTVLCDTYMNAVKNDSIRLQTFGLMINIVSFFLKKMINPLNYLKR